MSLFRSLNIIMDNMLEGYNVPPTIKRYLRDGASGVKEAWKTNPNCQQCSRKLSPAERKQGARVCAKCVKKNKSAVWGKDSDDDYSESVSEAYLTEFGNRPYPWRMTVDNSDQKQAQFTIPETGMVYKVSLWATKYPAPRNIRPDGSRFPVPPASPSQWEFGFGLHKAADHAWNSPTLGRDDIVGNTGVAIPVFATVIAIFKTMVKAARPQSIVYFAKDPSRKRLYSRLTKLIQRHVPGYKGTEPSSGHYEIVKEDIALPHKDTHMTIPTFKSFVAEQDTETVAVQPAAAGKIVSEVTPPGMEDWVTKNKARFHKQYGDRGNEVLYATAWDIYEKGKRD